MEAIERSRETDPGIDDVRRITALAVALRVLCIVNQLRLHDQNLVVTRHPKPQVTIDFTERTPFGFAFTTGHEATFRVPAGHRFVIVSLYRLTTLRSLAFTETACKRESSSTLYGSAENFSSHSR